MKPSFNPYEILGIATTASKKEIKLKYLSLTKQFHPDVSHHPNKIEKFQDIVKVRFIKCKSNTFQAYDMLKNPGQQGFIDFKKTRAPTTSMQSEPYQGPIYMSNGKMAFMIVGASAILGVIVSGIYMFQRNWFIQELESKETKLQGYYESVLRGAKPIKEHLKSLKSSSSTPTSSSESTKDTATKDEGK